MCHISKMITMLSEKKPDQNISLDKLSELKSITNFYLVIKRFLFQMSDKNEDD